MTEYEKNMREFLAKTRERIQIYGENTVLEYAKKFFNTSWNRDFDKFPIDLLSDEERAGYIHAKENLNMGFIDYILAERTLEKYAIKKQTRLYGGEEYIISINSNDQFIQELYTCYKRSIEHLASHMGGTEESDPDWPRWE